MEQMVKTGQSIIYGSTIGVSGSTWVDNGLQKLYFIISQRDDSTTPELVQYAIQRFNQVLGTSIPEIDWKADAAVTNVPMMSINEWAAYEIAQIKIDIENGRGEITD
ncbi:hypothetical protein WAE59_08615 [Pedobacter sp. GR22-6]